MIEIAILAVFAGLLVCAACSDIASLTIPNWISIALAILFPLAALVENVPMVEVGAHFLFGFSVLAVGFFLFHANIIGGGDAKLLAAAAIWTGFTGAPTFLLWTSVAGGVLAMSLLTARQFVRLTGLEPPFLDRLWKPQGGIPYGVAIMAGALMAIPELPFALVR